MVIFEPEIITIGGLGGTGTSSVGRALARARKAEFFSCGDFVRAELKKRAGSVYEKRSSDLDSLVDSEVRSFGELPPDSRQVVEGRLAWRFLPYSFKVLLVCPDSVRFRRIAERDGLASVEEAKSKTEKRELLDAEHYRALYEIREVCDPRQYDLVLRTGHEPVGRIVRRIVAHFIVRRYKGDSALLSSVRAA
ncbi:MAG: cytidylate kinase family protein [Patescibacteria group bacterium]